MIEETMDILFINVPVSINNGDKFLVWLKNRIENKKLGEVTTRVAVNHNCLDVLDDKKYNG